MFVCPFTGSDKIESLVPSKHRLPNGQYTILFVHPAYKNERFLNTTKRREDELTRAFKKR